MKRAIVLLSGGIDSATVLAIAHHEGYEIIALTFRYGQRHAVEVSRAQLLSSRFGVCSHHIVDVPDSIFAGSALVGAIKEEVPKGEQKIKGNSIPVTYVPARNLLFLSYGIACAEGFGAEAVFIGANVVDYSGYPDCRGEFLAAFEEAARLGTKCGVEGKPIRIIAPLLDLTKTEIIRRGISLGIDYSDTHSCYDPDDMGRACGVCDSCRIRRKGFADAGVPDPTVYVDNVIT
jgi:7-cyano-7-deazaguanine synthase